MDGFRTRGQAAAVDATRAMLRRGVPHAILLVGPGGVGKTTLARDLAAALLCLAPDPDDRPCRECRACRAVEHGNHPDLHRLAPVGPGAVIPIGGRDDRGIRDLIGELALLPVEGGARVAIIESAHRLTEDAQSAFLKTLEEPPRGTTLILCADDEERLLPTIRSRCVRLRLGPTGKRAIEEILADHGAADAPTAARLARTAEGRPGVALGFARSPDAIRIRAEIARTLLDLLREPRSARLIGIRDLAGRAADLVRALDADAPGDAPAARSSASSRARPAAEGDDAEASPTDAPAAVVRVPAAERRAAALTLVAIWRSVLRDLTLVALGDRAAVHDPDLLDDIEAARSMPAQQATAHLRRLDEAGERLEGNVSPELVLDGLALRWSG